MESINSTDSFSKYQIGESVGKGAFGKVYKALNTETGDFCAIKQIEKSIISEKQLPSIIQEIKLLQTLQHVNIVKFIESYETPKYLYFALEFIEGGSLGKMIKRYGNIQEPLISRYICQVLRGLEYLHGKGVIHRDIKSDNILITKEGIIKLADFGSCTYSAIDRKLTVVGTPFWMAPEVIQMDMNARSTACDIWSLGCTLLELLTGNPPYWELGTMPAMFAMVNDPHPPLPPNISPELKHFLQACFVRDINRRPTASQLLEHPWIRQYYIEHSEVTKHHQQHHPGSTKKSNSSLSVEYYSGDEQEDFESGDHANESPKELRERVQLLENQKKEMNKNIKKLKVYCISAMRDNKTMKALIKDLVSERDGYMLKLGLTPPPPPPILSQTSNTPTRSALEHANELLSHQQQQQPSHRDSPSTKHSRSSSAPISPPLKIATTSPSPSTTGAQIGSMGDKPSDRTSILDNGFFHPPPEDVHGIDNHSPTTDFLLSSPLSERKVNLSTSNPSNPNPKSLHRHSKPIKFSETLINQQDQSSNSLGAHFSSNNLNVYSTTSSTQSPTETDIYLKKSGGSINSSPFNQPQVSFGGQLVFDLNQQPSNNNNNNIQLSSSPLGGNNSLKSKKPPPSLVKESSQKSLLPPLTATSILASPGRKGSISSSSDSLTPPRKSSLSGGGGMLHSADLKNLTIGGGMVGQLSGSGEHSDDEGSSYGSGFLSSSGHYPHGGEDNQSVPPVESVVVNVQPPRVGDECKVKCGDGWYDAIVELVSGSTFVVTIKPFNIKREVSHSDVTLAPLQFPVTTTKKKSKFNLFGRSSTKS